MNTSLLKSTATFFLGVLLVACDDQDLGKSIADGDSMVGTTGTTADPSTSSPSGASTSLPGSDTSDESTSASDDATETGDTSAAQACSDAAISACYDAAFVACEGVEGPEDLCDAIFECDLLVLQCEPSDWDEYEDWEQRVLDPIEAFAPLNECNEWLDPCLLNARLYCELVPDQCSTYVTDCQDLFTTCWEDSLDPGFGPPECYVADGACEATEASICERQPAQCAPVAAVCDWVPTVC